MKMPEDFATALKEESYATCHLWNRHGTQASSIVIRKEIWIRLEKKPGEDWKYPVFFVYNYFEYGMTVPNCGCRVNEKPFHTLAEALKVAQFHEWKVRRLTRWGCAKWVEAELVKRPRVRKPKDGIWAFSDLHRVRKIKPNQLTKTLQHYASSGAAILADVVLEITRRTRLTLRRKHLVIEAAKLGARNQSNSNEREQYLKVARSVTLYPVYR
ncbi:MAG: hypothetical protein AAB365_01390 [Patescibacteria group bacterium]